MQNEATKSNGSKDYLTIMIDNQTFGIPVLQVQDVLREQEVTRIPLASPEVAGSLNLRGRIVTAIDVRRRLGLSDRENGDISMSVVVEHKNELFSLIIDSVGDVLSLKNTNFEKTPGTLEQTWRDISSGIFQLQDNLLVVMDVSALLENINHAKNKLRL